MVCKCYNENYNTFISAVFYECIASWNEYISFVFGWISIGLWLIADYPQLRVTFLTRSSEGMSTLFIVTWLVGDVANISSIFLLN